MWGEFDLDQVRGRLLRHIHETPTPPTMTFTTSPPCYASTPTLALRPHATQFMAELWTVAGKRACRRALKSCIVGHALSPTDGAAMAAMRARWLLTAIHNNPVAFAQILHGDPTIIWPERGAHEEPKPERRTCRARAKQDDERVFACGPVKRAAVTPRAAVTQELNAQNRRVKHTCRVSGGLSGM